MAEPTVIIIKDAVLKLGATAADVGAAGTGLSFECQTTSAAINATPNLQTVPATFCSPSSQAPAATSFELAITWLQDWTAPGGGLSKWAFDHDTEAMYFSLSLDPTEPPLATGQVRVVAGAYGGDAGVPLTTTATWPCPTKPTIDAPPAGAGLMAEGTEGEPVADATTEPALSGA